MKFLKSTLLIAATVAAIGLASPAFAGGRSHAPTGSGALGGVTTYSNSATTHGKNKASGFATGSADAGTDYGTGAGVSVAAGSSSSSSGGGTASNNSGAIAGAGAVKGSIY